MLHSQFTEFARQFTDSNVSQRNYYREGQKPTGFDRPVGLERIRYTNTGRNYEKFNGERWDIIFTVEGLEEEFESYEYTNLCDPQCELEDEMGERFWRETGKKYSRRETRTVNGGGGSIVGVIKFTAEDGTTGFCRY